MRKFARLVHAPRGTVLLVPHRCSVLHITWRAPLVLCRLCIHVCVTERAIWVRFQWADRYIGGALAHLGPVPTAVPVLRALVSRKRDTSNACVQLF